MPESKYLIPIGTAIVGVVGTIIVQQILNRRALFTYFVRHERIGLSADDAIFGRVRVTWNDNPIANLYWSTIELVNQSLKDYENVVVKIFTSDTQLLSEMTQIVGTPDVVKWTDNFVNDLRVPEGQQPSEVQRKTWSSSREYLVPTLNRGQVIRFHFLNSANTQNQPTIWLNVLRKGVRIRFHVPPQQFLGVPQPKVVLVGLVLSVIVVGFIVWCVDTVWIASISSFVLGVLVMLPGAAVIRAWRWFRNWYGG